MECNIAILYDFDGTLIKGDTTSLIMRSLLGIDDTDQHWKDMSEITKQANMDHVLNYMFRIKHEFEMRNSYPRTVTRGPLDKPKSCLSFLRDHAKNLHFFEGVIEWFDLIKEQQSSANIMHFIVSSGLYDVISASEIAKHFEAIYASGFIYNEHGHPIWPKLALDYTSKTQFIFRINKGLLALDDGKQLNSYTPYSERLVPFSNMIYIGDGLTDVPAMKMVKRKGGKSIAVYNAQEKESRTQVENLLQQERVNKIASADFRKNSELHSIVTEYISNICDA